ncbi:uncharacterized protein LOC130698100 [Daphnia carinata]|uniref:uncharacterized protein LOC130698100 n=1 Tax=Daphnia carinata TaxID=120202 RepID=UPI00257E9E6D|nr:uncharacterized protein LOC130698100 [Daphnia carinata]XP_057376891.1 uncharacterized protein LOC130698100 [Daphnia carinata]
MNRKLLAAANVLIGLISISGQIASYVHTRQVVDYVSSGLWGGAFMIATATLILLEKPAKDRRILTLICLSLASGFIMMVIYSWNLNRFFQMYTTWEICEFYAPGLLIDPSMCKALVTLHGLMISLGFFAVLINSALLILTCRKPVSRSQPKHSNTSDPLAPSRMRSTLI